MSPSSLHPSSSSSNGHQGWALLALAAAATVGTSYARRQDVALGGFFAERADCAAHGDGLPGVSAILAPIAQTQLSARGLKWLLGLGLLQPCLYFMLEVKALQFTSSGQAGTVAALAPLFVALLAWIWLKGGWGCMPFWACCSRWPGWCCCPWGPAISSRRPIRCWATPCNCWPCSASPFIW